MSLLNLFCFLTGASVVLGQLGFITNALIGDFPYVVSLQNAFQTPPNSHFCGGSIISSSWILTTAKCVYGREANSINVVAGTTQLDGSGTTYQIDEILVHEQYNPESYDFDIALLHTNTFIAFPLLRVLGIIIGHTVSSISLAADIVPEGTIGVVSNWNMGNSAPTANKLSSASVPIVSTSVCSTYFEVTANMICAGPGSSQQSNCTENDFGGALTVRGELIGVVSFGPGCGQLAPAVYANVYNLRDWIKQTTEL